MFRITLQGFPTAIELLGIFFVTILPEPITTLSPIVMPGFIIAPPPIQTLLPIVIGKAYSSPVFRGSNESGVLP